MIKCELQDGGTVDIQIKGPAADVNAEFGYIMQAWDIWNACMIALGENMTEMDVFEVEATNGNFFYVPKQSDGLLRRLRDLLEGGIN